MKKILIFIGILLIIPSIKADELFAQNATSAIMIEASTGDIIFEKNANEKLKPASMTNIMTT